MSGGEFKPGWFGPFLIALPFLVCLLDIAGANALVVFMTVPCLALGFSLTWAPPYPRLKRPPIRDGGGYQPESEIIGRPHRAPGDE